MSNYQAIFGGLPCHLSQQSRRDTFSGEVDPRGHLQQWLDEMANVRTLRHHRPAGQGRGGDSVEDVPATKGMAPINLSVYLETNRKA